MTMLPRRFIRKPFSPWSLSAASASSSTSRPFAPWLICSTQAPGSRSVSPPSSRSSIRIPKRSTRSSAASSAERVKYSAVETFLAQYRLEELRQMANAAWNQLDLLLLPTTGTTYTIAEVEADPVRLNTNLGFYTNFVNLLDLAAVAVPAGFRTDGLPFGVSLIAPASTDRALLSLADRLAPLSLGHHLGAVGTALSETASHPQRRDASRLHSSRGRRRTLSRTAAESSADLAWGALGRMHEKRRWIPALCTGWNGPAEARTNSRTGLRWSWY